MTKIRYYGTGSIPGFEANELPGRLIVLEGTDGVGRSTQVALLHEWLEANGYAVAQTGLARSSLVGPGLIRAKQGHTLGDITLNLFYATDFADRLEKEILPALRAGFVCLTDRYIYSVIARDGARGGLRLAAGAFRLRARAGCCVLSGSRPGSPDPARAGGRGV